MLSLDDPLVAANRSLVRDEPRRHMQTAHIPGGGPKEQTCQDCAQFHQTHALKRRDRGRCGGWALLRGMGAKYLPEYQAENRDWWHGLRSIPGATASCKYFEAEEAEEKVT